MIQAIILTPWTFHDGPWAELPHERLGKVFNGIINEISGISRLTCDISSKPLATIEWQ